MEYEFEETTVTKTENASELEPKKEVAVFGPVTFPYAISQLEKLKAECLALKISGLDDKEGLEIVKEKKKECVSTRLEIERLRNEGLKKIREHTRNTNNNAKALQAAFEPGEAHLKAEIDKIKAMEEELAQAEQRRKKVIYEARRDSLIEAGASFNGVKFNICFNHFVEILDDLLLGMSDDEFQQKLDDVKRQKILIDEDEAKKAQAMKEQQEREEAARKAKQEKADKLAEENRILAEKLRKQQEEQDERDRKQREAQQKIDAERVALEEKKLKVEQEARDKARTAKINENNRRIRLMHDIGCERNVGLSHFVWEDHRYPTETLLNLNDDEFNAQYSWIKKEILDTKRIREEERKAKAEALKPDKEKLSTFVKSLLPEFPEVTAKESNELLDNIHHELVGIIDKYIQLIDNL